jgi:hypothetical protein
MDPDERLRRLEARIVSGDHALQRQAEDLMAAAAHRAGRTAAWSLLALSGAAVLVVLDVWLRKRRAPIVPVARERRGIEPRRDRRDIAPRRDRLDATLWRLLPALGAIWRMVSELSALSGRVHRRR